MNACGRQTCTDNLQDRCGSAPSHSLIGLRLNSTETSQWRKKKETNVAGVKVTSGTYCNIQLIRTGRGNHAGGLVDQQSDDKSHRAAVQRLAEPE